MLPPLAHAVVTRAGWRAAYVVLGAGVVVRVTLAAMIMRRDPESLGLHPDGDPAPPARRQGARGDWPPGPALRSGAFWMLGAAFTATWAPVFIPLVHLVPLARDLGHPPGVGPWLVSTFGAPWWPRRWPPTCPRPASWAWPGPLEAECKSFRHA